VTSVSAAAERASQIQRALIAEGIFVPPRVRMEVILPVVRAAETEAENRAYERAAEIADGLSKKAFDDAFLIWRGIRALKSPSP
jgi:hypothetical protein